MELPHRDLQVLLVGPALINLIIAAIHFSPLQILSTCSSMACTTDLVESVWRMSCMRLARSASVSLPSTAALLSSLLTTPTQTSLCCAVGDIKCSSDICPPVTWRRRVRSSISCLLLRSCLWSSKNCWNSELGSAAQLLGADFTARWSNSVFILFTTVS